jgi:pyruvate/2-oxoglutarate/acetoin dehydrogenase E1 component/TPP-dependent pyruvate/acetoin dehydrogenase alpha subunit
MLRIRSFEEKIKELAQLNEIGGAAHLSTGQEAVAVGICAATRQSDQVLSTHRGHGHMIAKGADLRRMLAEILGRSTGYCRGMGGSMHIADYELGIAGANGIVGGGLSIATGLGLAAKLLKTDGICVCFFGDGAAAQGGLHEVLNLCAIWDLPVLYVCENNHYASSSPVSTTMATKPISRLAEAYDLPGRQVDGNDVREVFAAASEAVAKVRSEQKPYLLECVTYRYEGHYFGDPATYRDKAELADWRTNRDPIDRLRKHLIESGDASEQQLDEMDVAAAQEVDAAATAALEDPHPPVEDPRKHVYVDLWSQRDVAPVEPDTSSVATVELTCRDAVVRALDEELARDERVIILGEDIGRQGGAFQCTKGLYNKYGAERVRTTPISEVAIGGCTLGAALAGLRPVGEFEYSDFMTLAMDQIVNQTAKVHFMFGGGMHAPLVYRAPGGSGGRGNAAQHSQSLEAWFMHAPGLKVVMPATPLDIVGLLKTAIRDDDPVIFLEHKALYNYKGPAPADEYVLPFGRAHIKRKGTDITVVATSRMVIFSLAAAEELAKDGISVEVIDPRTLVPLDKETICQSVARTGRAVVISEGCQTCGVAAELSAMITEEVFDELDGPVVRLAGLDTPISYHRGIEQLSVPSVKSICCVVKRTLGAA